MSIKNTVTVNGVLLSTRMYCTYRYRRSVLLERNLVGGKEGRGDRRTRECERDVGVGGDGGCSVVDPLSPSGSSHPITHEIFSGARGESGALLSTDLFTEPVVVSSVFS